MSSFIPNIPTSELEERRLLLQAAASGSAPARLKLEQEYHVRVYTAAQCKTYRTKGPDKLSPEVRRKIDLVTERMRTPTDH
jgi:hypothetical protein